MTVDPATTTRPAPSGARNQGPTKDDRQAVARDIARAVGGAVGEAADRLPASAEAVRTALHDASHAIQVGSDQHLVGGTILSGGLALGLLIGGAHRALVLVALVPAIVMGLTLLDRRTSAEQTKARTH